MKGVIIISLIGLFLLFSGCTQPTGEVGSASSDKQMYVCSNGDTVSNPELCPKEESNEQASLQEANISLLFDTGEEAIPDKLILDGQEITTPKNKIDVTKLLEGNHKIIIIINDVEFSKEFYFEGNDISIKIKKPIETFVAVFSKANEIPISDISIYVNGEKKCTTAEDGTCSFYAKPETYTFRLQGEGILLEEIKNINSELSSFVFKIERKTPIKITVLDELTNTGASDIEVYLNGSLKGQTETNGTLSLPLMDEGSYVLEVKKGESSNTKTIQIDADNKEFSITIQTPRKITLKIIDSETKKPIDGEKVFLNGNGVGITIQTGEVNVENIMPGKYTLSLEGLSFASYGFTGAPPSTNIQIGNENYLTVEVDAPNPIFKVSVNCDKYFEAFELVYKGSCKVSIQNTGKINSQFTNARVFLYPINETDNSYPSEPANQLSLDFGTMAPGASEELDTEKVDAGFEYGRKTDAVVIVTDGWKYTPEKTEIIGMPPGMLDQLIVDVKNWCTSDGEECVNVAGRVAGGVVGKVLVAIATQGAPV